MRSLRMPMIALALVVLPFFVFVGYTSSKTQNGVLVDQVRINGLAIAAVFLVLVVAIFYFRRTQTRSGLGIALVCLALAGAALHITDALGYTAIYAKVQSLEGNAIAAGTSRNGERNVPPAAAASSQKGIETAPPGGQVTSDVNGLWQVTIPEAWKWKPQTLKRGTYIRAIGPTSEPRLISSELPDKHGDVVCIVENLPEPSSASMTQSELNALAESARAQYQSQVDELAERSSRESAFARLRDAGGTSVVTALIAERPYNGLVGFNGHALFYVPGKIVRADCYTKFRQSDQGYADEPTLKQLLSLLGSLGPG